MIISASRRTDIPAFYSEWFMNRLRQGFVYTRNPFNNRLISKVPLSPDQTSCIVFWTKNPENFLKHLPEIDRMGHRYYFHFTLTSYNSAIERNVPKKTTVIETFKRLSDEVGKERIIWRYDPVFLTDRYDISYHLRWYEYLAKQLSGYTDKCIFSFLDMYKKCEKNLKTVHVHPLNNKYKNCLAKNFHTIAQSCSINLEACAQEECFEKVGVSQTKCIDDNLISRLNGRELSFPKDKNQRKHCTCVTSVDIGAYNTCKNFCLYCYANNSRKAVLNNIEAHNVNSPLLIGFPRAKETIIDKKIISGKGVQLQLFNKE